MGCEQEHERLFKPEGAPKGSPREFCVLCAESRGTKKRKKAQEQADVPAVEELADAALVQRAYDELLAERYCWAKGFGWMRWNGQVWAETAEESVREAIRLWARGIVKPLIENPFLTRDVRQRVVALLGAYTIKCLAELSRGVCQVDAAIFDSEPDVLNTPSGIVDLRTGALSPHDPSRHMTRITSAAYDPEAEHLDWTSALSAVPEEVAEWLRVRFGQAITGHMTPDDVLLLLRGGGENGKSTVLAAVKSALGGYATYVSDRVLLADAGTHPTELTEFRGARLALTEELPEGGHLNAKRLKDTIGTPTMTARKIRQDSITWDSTHSLFLSTNYLPKVTETDHGTWRRLALVVFPFTYVTHGGALGPHERRGDPGLRDRVKDGHGQQGAVLAWLVAGAREWFAADKVMPRHPEAVIEATRRWREQSDLVMRYWAECLRPDPIAYITTSDMLDHFNEWITAQAHKQRSAQVFNAQFGEHEITKTHGVVMMQRRIKPGGEFRSLRPGSLARIQGGPPEQAPPGTKVRAWWGVRFTSDQDE